MKILLVVLILAAAATSVTFIHHRWTQRKSTPENAAVSTAPEPTSQMFAMQSVSGSAERLVGHIRVLTSSGGADVASEWQPETPQQQRHKSLMVLRQLYPDLGEALGLDVATEQQLFELLWDHGMDPREGLAPEAVDSLEARQDGELTALLGPDGLQRFKQYQQTLVARREVNRMNGRLSPNDQIRGQSKAQLILLVHKGTEPEREGWMPSSYQTLPPAVAGSPLSDALIAIAASEDYFRLRERSHRRMQREAAKLLTPAQLEGLARTYAEEDQSSRQSLANLREEVGLDPTVPDAPESTLGDVIRRRVPIAGDVTFELTLTVNGQPTQLKHSGPNKEMKGFQAADSVWVEATPVLYDDGWLDMLLSYFEPAPAGRVQIDQTVQMATQATLADGTPSAGYDAVSETLTRRRTYEIRATGITAQRAR